MQRHACGWTICLIIAALFVGGDALHAEISIASGDSGVIIFGITEGPDPIPQIWWDAVRNADPNLVLNPDGGERGDGRPDIFLDPVTGWPHVVWAYNTGTDFDIAYSTWTGERWTDIEFLTATSADEIDPRIFVDDMGIYVVWWQADPETTWLGIRPHEVGLWNLPEEVSPAAGGGRRPSVVTWNGSVLVAAESNDPEAGLRLVLSTRQEHSAYTTESVVSVTQSERLDVILHREQGKLWMDWKQSTTEFAYSRFVDDAWTPTTLVPWTDSTWLGEEEMRLRIRNEVLSDSESDPEPE